MKEETGLLRFHLRVSVEQAAAQVSPVRRQIRRLVVYHDRVHSGAVDNRPHQLVDASRTRVDTVDQQQVDLFAADVAVVHGCSWHGGGVEGL